MATHGAPWHIYAKGLLAHRAAYAEGDLRLHRCYARRLTHCEGYGMHAEGGGSGALVAESRLVRPQVVSRRRQSHSPAHAHSAVYRRDDGGASRLAEAVHTYGRGSD